MYKEMTTKQRSRGTEGLRAQNKERRWGALAQGTKQREKRGAQEGSRGRKRQTEGAVSGVLPSRTAPPWPGPHANTHAHARAHTHSLSHTRLSCTVDACTTDSARGSGCAGTHASASGW